MKNGIDGPRARALPALACALAGAVALAAAAPAHAARSYVIEQREGVNASRLTLATSGLRFDSLVPDRRGGQRRGNKAKPQTGLIIRYRDAHLFVLDPVRKVFDSLSLGSAVSSYEAELRTVRQAQPSERLPVRPGAKPSSGQAPLTQPRARLRRLRLTKRIGAVRVQAYLLQQGKLRQRLWYAPGLPGPPARIRALLARGVSGSAAGPLARALRAHAGQVPLRIDVPKGRGWRTTLKTVKIRRRSLGAHALDPPRGFKPSRLLGSAGRGQVHAADVPGAPIRCGILISDPINCTVGTVGPVSGHPAIWAFYWGTKFNDRKDFVGSMNRALENFVGDEFADPNSQAFWGPLGQYGVHRGKFLGYDIVDDNPDNSVGSWNFFDIEWFVLTHRFGSDAPNYWWRGSDEDPIFAIFVDQDEVDSSGWAGYHFFTPTEGILFSFLVHPAMPWFIVKVPSVKSLPTDRDSAGYRHAVDTASERASHEFVEAATDPYPFFSWADPLKEPIWEQGEIGDICQQGNTVPWGKATRVIQYGTAFQPYWSNDDEACVPDSRPSAQITYPTSGGTYSWGASQTFIVQTNDLFDGGPIPDGVLVSGAHARIRWDSDRDGLGIGHDHIFTTSSLSPGTHHISAFVENSQGGTRTAGPITVNVVVQPPTVRIDQPPDGQTFGSDEIVNYRGSAFDGHDGSLDSSATWSVDGTPVGTGASLFRYRIPTEGTHTVTLSARNSGGASSSASITVHIGPPTGKPTVQITQPADSSSFAAGDTITFSAQATAQGSASVPNSGYSWSDDPDGLLGTGQTIQHTLSGSNCQIVSHHVTVTATDTSNRSATDTITVNVGSIC